ncbi:hypothetical protein THASP1DRAFT_29793 [Thamnocephalis sphaerospora]|uniref:Uncharacterized protein n=1 Tax=Thamnocephalis sphaerospora TaxID=78915 RepID=A0A4P9XQS7_9FUNG|nr:hypothetical protein THASP1DRAFT_29793 [Thamnocephalis sphaerospora]|eukprot:RKP08388.1 hypothetical protein THASP1DRAFT_29793 [Thamnocephalis sphaerospora]
MSSDEPDNADAYQRLASFVGQQHRQLEQEFVYEDISQDAHLAVRSHVPKRAAAIALRSFHNAQLARIRAVFNRQAQHLLVLQLLQKRMRRTAHKPGTIRVPIEADYTSSEWLEYYPQSWPNSTDTAYPSSEAMEARYEQLRADVDGLQKALELIQEKHQCYKSLRDRIVCLTDGRIEEQLLTAESPAVEELDVMGALLVQLIERVNQNKETLEMLRETHSAKKPKRTDNPHDLV